MKFRILSNSKNVNVYVIKQFQNVVLWTCFQLVNLIQVEQCTGVMSWYAYLLNYSWEKAAGIAPEILFQVKP